jgi:hypothetical protein
MWPINTLFALAILEVVAAATFSLTIANNSAFNGVPINAMGSVFWLGGEPAEYCPLTNQTLCPSSNKTVFAGMSNLWVSLNFRWFVKIK